MIDGIVSNCSLCEERSLHLVGEGETQIMQCVWCGYVSSPKFIGEIGKNEEYDKLTDDMKGWAKESLGRIWIPSMFTLPDGMIYPENEGGTMKWKLADLVDIPESERKNYPVTVPTETDTQFHSKRYATEKATVYDNFYEVMIIVNERSKKNKEENFGQVELKLPKLKKSN